MTARTTGSAPLYWLADKVMASTFPKVSAALEEPNGLLACGGDLEPQRLLDAYRQGIFPWYVQGQPILWWSPDPRCVLAPDRIRVSRRLARTIRQGKFRVTFNQAFPAVIEGCSAPREAAADTWITSEMTTAYLRLHALGHAVSVECWQGKALAGGLYGVVMGRVFFGESMFSRITDASKVALVHLARRLCDQDFRLIDCQVYSDHLHSLGAQLLPRSAFTQLLSEHCAASQRQKQFAGA